MWFELISNKRPRHVSAKKEAVDKGDAHSRHFPSARKAFIKSFDIFLYFFFFSFCTWDTPLAARLAWSLSDLGPPLARYKDIIRHAVLGQKSKKRKKKVQQRQNTYETQSGLVVQQGGTNCQGDGRN